MLATKKLVVTLILALLFSAVAGFADIVAANPDSETLPLLAMLEEYVNYTIVRINGTLWAKIDGTYPLQILAEDPDAVSCVPDELPMVYPIPPETTNIHVWVKGTELEWSNWSYGTHHTAIGDWEMIYCVVSPVSEHFVLTIHYEHPLTLVNGSYLFLYDLNIGPYLTPLSSSSVAYFTVRFETPVSEIRAYTTWTDSIWNQKDFAFNSEDNVETVTIKMSSVLGEPLAGDLVVMFNDSSAEVAEEFPYWLIAVPVFLVVGSLMVIVFRRKHR